MDVPCVAVERGTSWVCCQHYPEVAALGLSFTLLELQAPGFEAISSLTLQL